jgi:hypothetical protein
MAVLRGPVVAEPPAVLRSFEPADWLSADAEAAFQEWKQARRVWAAEHPGSMLGNVLDQGARTVWASTPDSDRVAFATPADYGALKFTFRPARRLIRSWSPNRVWARVWRLTARLAAFWVSRSATVANRDVASGFDQRHNGSQPLQVVVASAVQLPELVLCTVWAVELQAS